MLPHKFFQERKDREREERRAKDLVGKLDREMLVLLGLRLLDAPLLNRFLTDQERKDYEPLFVAVADSCSSTQAGTSAPEDSSAAMTTGAPPSSASASASSASAGSSPLDGDGELLDCSGVLSSGVTSAATTPGVTPCRTTVSLVDWASAGAWTADHLELAVLAQIGRDYEGTAEFIAYLGCLFEAGGLVADTWGRQQQPGLTGKQFVRALDFLLFLNHLVGIKWGSIGGGGVRGEEVLESSLSHNLRDVPKVGCYGEEGIILSWVEDMDGLRGDGLLSW